MAAASVEAASGAGEVVTIAIKVQHPDEDDADLDFDPEDDQDFFRDECIVEIKRKWLAGEFFQAPIERWNFEGSSQARLTLFLPEGCVASEGARLLKLRLGSDFARKRKAPKSTPQERAWSPVDWWRATSGRATSLFGALHLFHFTLQKDFACEVAKALKLYRFRCPAWVETIAEALDIEVEVIKPPVASLDVPFETFQSLLSNALKKESAGNFRTMVERTIAGSNFEHDEVMKALVEAWFSLFHWEPEVIKVAGNRAPTLPLLGGSKDESKAIPWLHRLIEDLVQEHPETACACHMALQLRFGACRGKYKVIRKQSDGTETEEEHFATFFLEPVQKLRAVCTNSLFIKSGLDWPTTQQAFTRFAKISCPTDHFAFVDGSNIHARHSVDPMAFAVANPAAQHLWLQSLPAEALSDFQGRAHLVDASVRHILLKHASVLSAKDIEFLTTASFPSSRFADLGDAKHQGPDKKRQRRS